MSDKLPDACIYCDSLEMSGGALGAFIPDDSILYGAKPGKQRMIFYVLCEPCFKQRDALMPVIEDILLETMRGAS